jgi:hypothetical protein
MARAGLALLMTLMTAAGCAESDAAGEGPGAARDAADEVVLGPADGRDLPAIDLDRVQEGMAAPDFTLTSLAGPAVTLSSFRGAKSVVLVFYRGHW